MATGPKATSLKSSTASLPETRRSPERGESAIQHSYDAVNRATGTQPLEYERREARTDEKPSDWFFWLIACISFAILFLIPPVIYHAFH